MMESEAGVVVVLSGWSATRASLAARIAAMRGRSRVDVVYRVPEQAAVVRRLVLGGMVDVDIDHVAREIVHQAPPAFVAAAQKLKAESGDRVVLIVVVRN